VPNAAAFFDLDKTLIEGSSAIDFARASFKRGLLSRRQMAKDLLANLKFRVQGSTDVGTEQLRNRVLDAIAGMRQRDLARIAPDVLATLLPRLYPQMLQEAYEHQDAGRPVYIVTAASQEMAEMLAYVLTFDGGIGTRSELHEGVYTGRPDGPLTYREGKVEAMRRVAAQDGIDLAESFAYSDSESDLPMLRAVGNPVAVNPDDALERIAREEGWRIMRFDQLARRLKIGAGVGVLAAGMAGTGFVAARLAERRTAAARVRRRLRRQG
jgi:HAD superfamily hydrolase (TIGR01490 family)